GLLSRIAQIGSRIHTRATRLRSIWPNKLRASRLGLSTVLYGGWMRRKPSQAVREVSPAPEWGRNCRSLTAATQDLNTPDQPLFQEEIACGVMVLGVDTPGIGNFARSAGFLDILSLTFLLNRGLVMRGLAVSNEQQGGWHQ